MIVFKEKLEHFWKNKIVILGINSNFKDNFCILPQDILFRKAGGISLKREEMIIIPFTSSLYKGKERTFSSSFLKASTVGFSNAKL